VVGSADGNEEIFLFTSNLNPFDLEIHFYQLSERFENLVWSSVASFDPIKDVHGGCAFVFRTPTYQLPGDSLNTPIRVLFKLYQPSTRACSDPCAFYYVNDAMNTYAYNAHVLKHSIDENVKFGASADVIIEASCYDESSADDEPSGFDEVDFRCKRTKVSN
jgi:hypothetical protein